MKKLNMLRSKNGLQSVSGCYKKCGVVTIVLDQYPVNLGCTNVTMQLGVNLLNFMEIGGFRSLEMTISGIYPPL